MRKIAFFAPLFLLACAKGQNPAHPAMIVFQSVETGLPRLYAAPETPGSNAAALTPTGVRAAFCGAVGGSAAGNSTSAAYWTRSGSTWSGPFGLPAGCSSAVDVDESGRIVANDCTNGNRRTPAVILPPYGSGIVIFLGGLGDSRNASSAQGISATNGWIVGQASLKNLGTGVYWKM